MKQGIALKATFSGRQSPLFGWKIPNTKHKDQHHENLVPLNNGQYSSPTKASSNQLIQEYGRQIKKMTSQSESKKIEMLKNIEKIAEGGKT